MENIYALLKCFGDRYMNCDEEQAELDLHVGREDMVATFNAIVDYAELLLPIEE